MSSSPTSPLPPPPSYPAPAISANDLSILPLKQLQYNLSSGSTNSFFVGPTGVAGNGTVSTASSPGGIKRGSEVISQKRDERELEVQDSFEDTLQETKERWSSFDDIHDDDDCYV